jgi:hypothetical protein
MRTDIAMRVHYSTLGKVKLFRNCEPGLLKDLVVLLRPVIYLPGDYICRKNDIGKEMFIIQSGQVQVWNVVYLSIQFLRFFPDFFINGHNMLSHTSSQILNLNDFFLS